MNLQPGQEIVITAKADGTLSIDAVGFKGGGCLKAIQAMRDAMSLTAGTEEHKSEFYETEDELQVRISN